MKIVWLLVIETRPRGDDSERIKLPRWAYLSAVGLAVVGLSAILIWRGTGHW